MRKIVVSIVMYVLVLSVVNSQGSISMTLSSDTIYIGDRVELQYIIRIPSSLDKAKLDFSELDSTLNLAYSEQNSTLDEFLDWSHLNFIPAIQFNENRLLDLSKVQSRVEGTNNVYTFSQSLSIFSLGVFDIEAPKILSSSAVVLMPLQRPRLFVKAPESLLAKDSIELRSIKPIIETSFALEDILIYVYLLLGLIAVGFLLYWLSKRKMSHTEGLDAELETKPISASEQALHKLRELKSEELWQNGKVKEYQSILTDTIRQYLEGRFGIRALEMTTDEISQALKKTNFDTKQESKLKEILQMADLIKFAKAKPDESIHEQYFNTAVQFILDTRVVDQIEEAE